MLKKIIATILFIHSIILFADNAEATRIYTEAYKAYQEQKYYQAATMFADAFILADSPTIKANCLKAQIGAWRMCEMPYREYKAIEALLTRYPEFANFKELTAREYAIGTAYYNGLREPAYWSLRWIPWLTDDNKCTEIYQQALKRAPFLPEAPAARLRLAHLFDEQGKVAQSLEQYRIILRDYPESKESRYALLALANGLLILAERGDGDGKYITEAYDVLEKFRKKYPEAAEISWVNRKLLLYKDLQGKRYYDMACYYNKNGRPDAAKRYLAIVLRDYPESLSAPDAEKLLVKLDKTFMPGDYVPPAGSRLPVLRTYQIPGEASRVLISPQSEKKTPYLIAVPDIANSYKDKDK